MTNMFSKTLASVYIATNLKLEFVPKYLKFCSSKNTLRYDNFYFVEFIILSLY